MSQKHMHLKELDILSRFQLQLSHLKPFEDRLETDSRELEMMLKSMPTSLTFSKEDSVELNRLSNAYTVAHSSWLSEKLKVLQLKSQCRLIQSMLARQEQDGLIMDDLTLSLENQDWNQKRGQLLKEIQQEIESQGFLEILEPFHRAVYTYRQNCSSKLIELVAHKLSDLDTNVASMQKFCNHAQLVQAFFMKLTASLTALKEYLHIQINLLQEKQVNAHSSLNLGTIYASI